MQDTLQPRVFRVSEITREIKSLLEESFPTVWIEGEVSNYRPHHSGHMYFTLKDAEAQISAVVWRSRATLLPIQLEDGQNVRVFGNLRLYEKAGRYQVDCLIIEPAGIGPLQALFEQLKKNLSAEGLFDPAYKKPIPAYPNTICVLTSPTGAALRDIISVIKRRSPSTKLLILGVKVQGEGAADDIVRAIDLVNREIEADVIILGRGGGSLEDLWPFNEERVARAIFASEIPIISAVGHEIDFTIADFVADLRAPTPSAAAELAVADDFELSRYLSKIRSQLNSYALKKIEQLHTKISSIRTGYAMRFPEDRVRQYIQRTDELSQRIFTSYKSSLLMLQERLNQYSAQLDSLNPKNVMHRGFALIYKQGQIMASAKPILVDDLVTIKMKDGSLESKVLGKKNE